VLEPVCEPASSPLCAPPRWSDWHGGWVRVESRETAEARYGEIASALSRTTLELLCRNEAGELKKDCEPIRWGWDGKKNRGRIKDLAIAGLTAMILESGAREDVQVGRGRYRRPVDGGQGRGPGNEGCLMQIIPSMAPRIATWLSPEERALGREGQEAVMQTLLGRDELAMRRCFEVGLRMLAGSRTRCEIKLRKWYRDRKLPFREPEGAWVYGMYSYYGVGPSGAAEGCYDANGGKTRSRYRLFHLLLKKSPEVTFVATGDERQAGL